MQKRTSFQHCEISHFSAIDSSYFVKSTLRASVYPFNTLQCITGMFKVSMKKFDAKKLIYHKLKAFSTLPLFYHCKYRIAVEAAKVVINSFKLSVCPSSTRIVI